ncbi:tetratricopeptide repeat-containing sensor histidine kinase [Christiangramia forsetii]|uniref:histidine kinase n=2 Tax=Christiangramia forsetii TaxID=411153 RepID=A0M4N1_CHRFK|nr:tetratricopeptide repeat-containing sensor histidine kinase [Christiangramia forsetii]CAL67576.1 two-component system sensor histidine kinase [Christiangramia forsetii KT0803]
MNLRPLLHTFGIFCFLALSSCTNKEISSKSQIRKDSTSYYFQKGKNSEEIQEKIINFNKALQSIKTIEDSLMLDILDNKIYYHNRLKEYDSSLHFADRLIKTAQIQNDSAFIATGYYRKAFIFQYLNQNEKQFENTYAAREIYLKIGDTASAGRRTAEMANAQSQLTDYTGAQQTATEALEYLSENDSVYLSSMYNTIATTYRNQEFYQDAAKEWRNALKYASRSRDSLSNLNNIALALQDDKKFKEAIKIFEKILENSNLTDRKSRARFMDNLAYTKWLQDSSAVVEDELLYAKEIRRKENDRNGLLASYNHLSDYFRNKDTNLSRIYADSLLITAINTGSKTAQLNAIQKLIQLSPANKTKDLSDRYIQLNDGIRSENIRAKNFFAKIRYDEEQKQKEIDTLETQTALQRIEAMELQNQIIILSLVGLLILVSGGFGFYYLRQKHTREKIREAHLTETRISKKIHDELANDVYNVMSGLQSIVPNNMIDKLEHIYDRTRNISRENSSIPTGTNYLPHLLSTLSATVPDDTRLILRGENSINWNQLVPEKKIILYRVLQEIMINMKKHSNASLVAVIFSEEKSLLNINYSDNGTGTSLQNLKTGNGILNMENRILSIKGKLNFETEQEKGLKILIQIPS